MSLVRTSGPVAAMTFVAILRSSLALAALLLFGLVRTDRAEAASVGPPWPTKEWRTSAPEDQGMDSAALAKLVDFGATHGLESVLIVRRGTIVLEAYYAPFRAGVKHRVNSVTKSVIGTLVAIALKERRLDSPDQRVVDFFADRTIANVDERKTAITIQNLLDMTSGLSWTEPLDQGQPQSLVAMERSPDWVQFVLDQPMAAGPGTKFNYSSGNTHLLSAILAKATGESALDYARQRLFGPLGISNVFWRRDPQGNPIGGYGLFLQPRDMAKLGYLYLHNGVWDGTQIVPPEWIDRVRHATIPMGIANLRYANLFWVDSGRDAYFANGFHGQRIFVMPTQDIVAVVTATSHSAASGVEIGMIADAVKSDGPIAPDVAAQSLLASRVQEAATEKLLAVGPAPEIARAISGKVYRFSDNPFGLELVDVDPRRPKSVLRLRSQTRAARRAGRTVRGSDRPRRPLSHRTAQTRPNDPGREGRLELRRLVRHRVRGYRRRQPAKGDPDLQGQHGRSDGHAGGRPRRRDSRRDPRLTQARRGNGTARTAFGQDHIGSPQRYCQPPPGSGPWYGVLRQWPQGPRQKPGGQPFQP